MKRSAKQRKRGRDGDGEKTTFFMRVWDKCANEVIAFHTSFACNYRNDCSVHQNGIAQECIVLMHYIMHNNTSYTHTRHTHRHIQSQTETQGQGRKQRPKEGDRSYIMFAHCISNEQDIGFLIIAHSTQQLYPWVFRAVHFHVVP